MSDNTKIEWADATLKYVNGCTVVSPGCTNCYAMRLAGTRLKHHPSRAGLTRDTKAGPVWTGEIRINEAALEQALRWRKPRAIFWNAHGDLFHESVPDAAIDRQFAVMALTPHHRHMVLTKRSARMREYTTKGFGRLADTIIRFRRERGDVGVVVPLPHVRPGAAWFPLANVWLGVSVEDQARADERIPDLLATSAAIRFISAEPLLGPVDLRRWTDVFSMGVWLQHLDWVIAGGESGPKARPMHPDWARSLRDQCAAAGVAFHFKQWGEFAPRLNSFTGDMQQPSVVESRGSPEVAWPDGTIGDGHHDAKGGLGINLDRIGKKRAGRLLDGVEHDGVPA